MGRLAPNQISREIMSIAKREVVTASLSTSVYEIVRIMTKEGFRRIPIVDESSKGLQGIITSTDMVDYFGGGDKFGIIKREFKGSFFKAIKEPVKFVMRLNPPAVRSVATIGQAIRLMKEQGVGGLPIVDNAGRVLAIVTERDLLRVFEEEVEEVKVADLMTRNVVTATDETSILEAERRMVKRSFRRLPIVARGRLVGIITAMDIVRFFGSGEAFQHLRSGTIDKVLQTPALQIGTKELVTIASNADAGEAAGTMKKRHVGALPVVDNESLVGILTERDFFKLIRR